jgi:oligopeptide/dipeptide ABC transporter ATP-binding protein
MLLRVEDLSVSFRTSHGHFKAVDGISFELAKGESLGIVGESGCGKSVSALSILRLIPSPPAQVDSGKILFEDTDLLQLPINKLREIRGRRISMIFQEPMTSLNPVFKVGDQIAEAILRHKKTSKSEVRSQVLQMLDRVRIPRAKELIDFYPHQLSGGLRQRIMIAMALACEPEILIADEPTTALDVTIQAQILSLIDELRKELGMSVILITHDFGVIAQVADRVNVMYAGRIVETADVQRIFDHPQHPYTRALQKAIPEPSKKGSKLYSIPFSVPSAEEIGNGVKIEERWKDLEVSLKDYQEEPIDRPKLQDKTSLLEIQSLKVKFPISSDFMGRPKTWIDAVDDLSLNIRQGETLGLVGESGCGKSTLGKAIVRLVKASAGKVLFEGKDILGLSSYDLQMVRQQIQMIFQDPYSSLNPRMKVEEILQEPLIIHKIGSKDEQKRKVFELLDLVSLPRSAAKKFPHEFSGGQRQRIGIARAVSVRPKLLLADEPVSALDVSIQAQILNLLEDLKREFGLSFLFVSHDLGVVHYFCDRIAVMNEGKLVEELQPEQVFDESYEKQPYTQRLLMSIPRNRPSAIQSN